MINRSLIFRKETERCVICGKELKHKHKPMQGWGIEGFLCGDCHLDKMKEYYVDGKVPKKKIANCELCGKELDPDDTYELHKGLNLKSKICRECFQSKKKEDEKKIENCAMCGKKLGFFRYHPKKEWNINGQLCRKCWDSQNTGLEH